MTCAIATTSEDTSELEDLARSAGYLVLYEVIQRRTSPSPAAFLGKGKIEDLKEAIRFRPISAVLINGQLKPSQHYLLENELSLECVDRVRLVLNIFAQRASSKEARLQVEKATLEYEIPLIREWIHNAKAGEHPGFLGSGEYETDAYYELIRRRLAKIRKELAKLDVNRGLKRAQRRKRGLFSVSLAGYTNAGKSSLLAALTGKKVIVDDRMFSTLATLRAGLEKSDDEVVVSDTIGFLSDLPHFLIESFKGTIEEIFESDLVILVLDSSDTQEEMHRKLDTSKEILFPDVDPSRLIVVLSKTVLVEGELGSLSKIKDSIPCRDIVAISSTTGEGIETLIEKIQAFFDFPILVSFEAPQSAELEGLISWTHNRGRVDRVEYGEQTLVTAGYRERDAASIVRRILDLGGRMLGEEAEVITNP